MDRDSDLMRKRFNLDKMKQYAVDKFGYQQEYIKTNKNSIIQTKRSQKYKDKNADISIIAT